MHKNGPRFKKYNNEFNISSLMFMYNPPFPYKTVVFDINIFTPSQGRLKIWTEHSTLILLNLNPFEIALQKFQHFYNS